MSDFAQRLTARAAELELTLAPEAVAQLDAYRRILQEWNQAMSLVAEADDTTLLEKHFLDSLRLAAVLRGLPAVADGGSLADIGAGGGLPGLVIKAALPELRVVMVESHKRKAAFILEAARAMGLQVEALALRAEEVGRLPAHREQHDRVTARRVAGLAVLYEYTLPLLRPGGVAVLPKGEGLDDELAAAAGVAEQLGGGPATVEEHGGRRFVVVEKRSATPDAYPRAPGRPSKRPLHGS